MKKILAIILASLMLLSFAACDNGNQEETTTEAPVNNEETTAANNDTTETETEAVVELAYADSVELLTLIWNSYADDEKFMVWGGDYVTMVDGAPGAFSLEGEEAAGSMNSLLSYPTEDFDKLVDAASLLHGMMLNNFTSAAYHYGDAETASAMVENIKNSVLNTQFMCGFPEKLAIITAPGNYVIMVYGHGEGCVDPFVEKTLGAIDGAEVVVNQLIAE